LINYIIGSARLIFDLFIKLISSFITIRKSSHQTNNFVKKSNLKRHIMNKKLRGEVSKIFDTLYESLNTCGKKKGF